MQVTKIKIPTEITDASIKQYLADCVMVVRNKAPKDNDKLFDRLLKESYGGKPSRVFEYVPCTIPQPEVFMQWKAEGGALRQFFGFLSQDATLYCTNARELLAWGWAWEEVLEVIDFTHYRAVQIKAPYFLYGQASTHNQITSVSHSNRYTEAGLGYWMPPGYLEYVYSVPYLATEEAAQIHWNKRVQRSAPEDLEVFMNKVLGIKRREVYARGSDMLAYRVYTLGGYTNNPNAWPHFINQRLKDAHTQKEMRDLAALIEKEIS